MSNEYYYPQAVGPLTHGAGGMQMPAAPYAAHGYPGGMPAPGGMPMQQGGYMPTPVPPHYMQGVYPNAPQQSSSVFSFTNDRFLKGLLIGAAATYLITNESVQKTAIKSAVKVWSLVQGGVEEMKERFHDAEAEIQAAEAAKE